MAYERRQFLFSAAGAMFGPPLCRAMSNPQMVSAPSSAKKQGHPDRRLDVCLLSDVEDIFSPPELGNDDSIKEVATILTEEGVRANFMVMGSARAYLGIATERT